MAASQAPVGPVLDAEVVRCNFPDDAAPSWRTLRYSTDPTAAIELIALFSIFASVTIDARGRDGGDWYVVSLVDTNIVDDGEWEAAGEGETVMEAMARAATDMRDGE